jgi:hypothetical protein
MRECLGCAREEGLLFYSNRTQEWKQLDNDGGGMNYLEIFLDSIHGYYGASRKYGGLEPLPAFMNAVKLAFRLAFIEKIRDIPDIGGEH